MGSSARSSAGLEAAARAIATRARSPCESRATRWVARSDEADRLEGGKRRWTAVVHTAQRQRELDVLEGGEVRDELGLLADVGDLRAAKRRPAGTVELAQVDAVDHHGAGIREVEAGQEVQERRLPRPGRAGHDVQPSTLELGVEPGEDGSRPVAAREPASLRDDRAALHHGVRHRRGLGGRPRFADVRDDDTAVLEARRRLGADARAEQQLFGQAQPAAAAHDDRVARLVAAAPLLRDPPVADAHDAVGDARGLGVVADDHRRAAVLAHELGEHVVDLVGGRGVELAGGLVGEEEPRPVGERGAERDALLLAAGELRRPPVALLREADPLEQLVRATEARWAGGRRAGRAAARRARARSARARAPARSAGRHSRAATSGSSASRRAGSLPMSSP